MTAWRTVHASPTFTTEFDSSGTATRRTIPAPLTSWADYLGVELPERLVRMDFPGSVTAAATTLARDVTVGTALARHKN